MAANLACVLGGGARRGDRPAHLEVPSLAVAFNAAVVVRGWGMYARTLQRTRTPRATEMGACDAPSSVADPDDPAAPRVPRMSTDSRGIRRGNHGGAVLHSTRMASLQHDDAKSDRLMRCNGRITQVCCSAVCSMMHCTAMVQWALSHGRWRHPLLPHPSKCFSVH
jgi:hypothetical protein